jgi:hypothetical protein
MSTIVGLPGARKDPKVTLHQLLEDPDIKALTIIVQRSDGTYDVEWTSQKISELCMAAMVLHGLAVREARGE